MTRHLPVVFALLLALTAAACGSPTAPSRASVSPSAVTVALTVRILEYQTERPLVGAIVHLADTSCVTTADGTCVLAAPIAQVIEVTARAAGYQAFTASGTLGGRERWTFYLEPQP